MSVNIGVFAIQGDIHENMLSARRALEESGVQGTVSAVITPDELSELDGLIIPGGESTTIGQLSLVNGSLKTIKEKIQGGMPVLGICAGLVLLSNSTSDRIVGKTQQPLFEVLDATLERNSFGRQNSSFEAYISLDQIGIPKFHGVFIRAPSISTTSPDVQVLSKIGDKIVAVKKDNIIGTAFHPELTDDTSLHRYLVEAAAK